MANTTRLNERPPSPLSFPLISPLSSLSLSFSLSFSSLSRFLSSALTYRLSFLTSSREELARQALHLMSLSPDPRKVYTGILKHFDAQRKCGYIHSQDAEAAVCRFQQIDQLFSSPVLTLSSARPT